MGRLSALSPSVFYQNANGSYRRRLSPQDYIKSQEQLELAFVVFLFKTECKYQTADPDNGEKDGTAIQNHCHRSLSTKQNWEYRFLAASMSTISFHHFHNNLVQICLAENSDDHSFPSLNQGFIFCQNQMEIVSFPEVNRIMMDILRRFNLASPRASSNMISGYRHCSCQVAQIICHIHPITCCGSAIFNANRLCDQFFALGSTQKRNVRA